MQVLVASKLLMSRLRSNKGLVDTINKKEKTKEDLQYILERIKKLKFFREFLENTFKGGSPDILLNVCSTLRHVFVDQGELIIQQGETSNNKLYVILTGNVYVCKSDITLDYMSENQSIRTPIIKQPLRIKKKAITTSPLTLEEFENFIQKKYGKILRIMKTGEGFGEQALLRNVKRTASIIAKTECELLMIEKEDFTCILEEYKQAYHHKEILLHDVFPFIRKEIHSSKQIEGLIFSFSKENFVKGTILTSEEKLNETPKLFVIDEGEFLVEKNIVINGKKIEKARISVIGNKSVVGEEILFDSQYYYNVTCITMNGSGFVISRNNILKNCPKLLIDNIKKNWEEKKNIRTEIYQDCLISINEKNKITTRLKINNSEQRWNFFENNMGIVRNEKTKILTKNRLKEELKKITKKYLVEKTGTYLKSNENIFQKINLQNLTEANNDSQYFQESEFSPLQRKYKKKYYIYF